MVNFLSWRYAASLVATGLLLVASPQLTHAQHDVLGIDILSGPVEVVSESSAGVLHTGAGIVESRWYRDGHIHGASYFEGFCWDGTNPGYSWRLRGGSTLASDLSLKFNPGGNCLTFEPERPAPNTQTTPGAEGTGNPLPEPEPSPSSCIITNPDIAVGQSPLDGPLENSQGLGEFYLVATYEYAGSVYLNIDLVRNPINKDNTTLPPNSPMAYSIESVLNNRWIHEGSNPNVDVSKQSEFAMTYEDGGAIYGIFGKLYVPALGGYYNGRRLGLTASDVAANLGSLIIAGLSSTGAIDPFRVSPPTAANVSYSQPDVSLTHLFPVPTEFFRDSRMFFSYVKHDVDPQSEMFAINVTAGTFSSTPVLATHEPYSSPSRLQTPRIVASIVPLGYIATYQESIAATLTDCDAPAMPPRSIIHTATARVVTTATSTSFTWKNTRFDNKTHINRCITADAASNVNSNTEPVIANNSIHVGSTILWAHSGGVTHHLLDGSDILSHRVGTYGFHVPSNPVTLNPPGTHGRINHPAGNQIAPSIDCTGSVYPVIAWYNDGSSVSFPNYVVAEDHDTGSAQRASAPNVPSTVMQPDAPTKNIHVIPNPTSATGSLGIDLAKDEQVTEIAIVDIKTGRVLNHVSANALPKEMTTGTKLRVPLRRLLPTSCPQGLYLVKVVTNRSVYTTHMEFTAAE
jgi:hypothetical protein